jgi:hypothetical protein
VSTVKLTPQVVGNIPASELAGVSGPAGTLAVGTAPIGVQIAGLFKAVGQTVTAGGTGTVMFPPVPSGAMYLLQRYVVACENDPGSQCSLYLGEIATPFLEDGTLRGDLDVADGSPPIMVPGGEVIIFHWVNAGTGNVATAKIQYALASSG